MARAIASRRTHLAGLGGAAALALTTLPGRGVEAAASSPDADPSVVADLEAEATGLTGSPPRPVD
jgi:hypothetical protein